MTQDNLIPLRSIKFTMNTDFGALTTLVEEGKLHGFDAFNRLGPASDEQRASILNLLAKVFDAHQRPTPDSFWMQLGFDLEDLDGIGNLTGFSATDLLRIGIALPASVESPAPSLVFRGTAETQASTSPKGRVHRKSTRSDALTPAIAKARELADDPSNLLCVWNQLCLLADTQHWPLLRWPPESPDTVYRLSSR